MTDSKIPNVLDSVGLVVKRQSNSITKESTQCETLLSVKRPRKNRDETNADSSEPKSKKRPYKSLRYNCSKCQFSALTSFSLERHTKCHGQNGKFSCPHCDFSCNHKHLMEYHSVHSHKSTPSKVL